MKESARYILQILVFVALILSIGTVGYLLIEEGMTPSNAFYMAVTAITPTQFDEVHQLSVAGRYFTVALVFCGFGAVVAFATQFARLIIQSELEGVGVFTRKQMRRRIHRMKSHYIVCGFSEIGGAICEELMDQQLPFVVIADDEASIATIARHGYPMVRGNPTTDVSLKEAEIERAQGVIAVLADDSDNLFISLAARELNPKIFIIARGEDSSVEHRILRAGADIVVSPMKLGGRQIAGLIKQQANGKTSPLNSEKSAVLGLGLTVYRHLEPVPRSLEEILIEPKFDCEGAVGAAGIHRADGSFEPTPAQDVEIRQGDSVVLVTKADRVKETGRGGQATGKTILLADDHRALRLLFARKLAAAGHDVVQAATGDQVFQLACTHQPDVIVLDVQMPEKNGYEICKSLRQTPRFANVPIILYSGEETDEFIRRGEEAGANLCLRKSSKSSELLAGIDKVIAHGADSTKARLAEMGFASDEPDSRPVEAEVFDINTAMECAGGDRQLVLDVLTAVVEDTPQIMRRIDNAMQHGDAAQIQLESHSLKSSVTILGASRAERIAQKFELAAADNRSEDFESLHSELKQEIDTLLEALKKYA